MINELFRSRYNNNIFYSHNLSGFDIVFIKKRLNNYNDTLQYIYNISCIFRDDKIIQIKTQKGIKIHLLLEIVIVYYTII